MVVGVISSLGALDAQTCSDQAPPCDLLELRLGEIELQGDSWLARAQKLRDRGIPILITVRNNKEGGTWEDADPERLRLFNLGLTDFSLVDVELESRHLYRVADLARQFNKPLVVSYHDFEKTPDIRVLNGLAERVAEIDSVVLKIALKANEEKDIKLLECFLKQDLPFPVCVLAMGEAWRETRVTFPLLGSCLTYGYLDKPSAPGQHSCEELSRLMRGASNS